MWYGQVKFFKNAGAKMLGFVLLLAFVFNPAMIRVYLCSFRSVIPLFSPPVGDQKELLELLKNEKIKLGLSSKNIRILLVPSRPYFKAETEKINRNFYIIRCAIGSARTVVPHELYHIYDNVAFSAEQGLGEFIWQIKYLYWWEPRAIFYEFIRLRACNLTLKQTS